jgi:hypothetical protein
MGRGTTGRKKEMGGVKVKVPCTLYGMLPFTVYNEYAPMKKRRNFRA